MSPDHSAAAKSLPPARLLADMGVSSPQFVTETAIAQIWRVCRADGTAAALKLYISGDMGNEAQGCAYLRGVKGAGAARIFGQTPSAILMEWLPGPSLGDLSREGRDRDAAAELAAVARALHAAPLFSTADWPELDVWFEGLFSLEVAADCTDGARRAIARSQSLARELLASMRDKHPLHGDLHHENVRHGPRGYCAFDAKGILGDRAFELANAFRHPLGAPGLIRDPARIRSLRDMWSGALDVDARRLIGWAVAKTGLSISWRNSGRLSQDPELDLLDLLIAIHDGG